MPDISEAAIRLAGTVATGGEVLPLGLGLGLGLAEALPLGLALALGDGAGLGSADGDGSGLGLHDGPGLALAVPEGSGLGPGLHDASGPGEVVPNRLAGPVAAGDAPGRTARTSPSASGSASSRRYKTLDRPGLAGPGTDLVSAGVMLTVSAAGWPSSGDAVI
jgi:hypothetical protein